MAYVRTAEFAQAEEIATALANPSNRHDVVHAMICAKARQGDGATALSDVERLLKGNDRILTLAELAVILVDTGDITVTVR